ncbi:MAG TPA: rRNA maturation RNase YbeY [Candidatus Rubrimentiphilum sp.]|nr:rRNA maturation RNase YbeY [Candidatus Rubrimentiphilum sp.]
MIALRNDAPDPAIDSRRLRSTAQKLLRILGQADATLSIALVNDVAIRQLNRRYRDKDKATDVLSFVAQEPLGDLAISVDTARRQAADYGAPLQNEIYRLLIHGILHLLGHDHREKSERAAMEAAERRLARAIAMPWPYD